MKKLYFVLIVLLGTRMLAAETVSLDILKSDESFIYSDYYRVKEDPRVTRINLLNLAHVNEKFPMPATPYNRDKHFGGWLRDKNDDSCLNTRGKVLVRDSVSDVTYASHGCTVNGGEWNDLYTAKTFKYAADLQIDHLVPLKNAYMTGAHEWSFKKRCLYANYLGNNFHLLAVNGRENMKKSDSSPSSYMPPNKKFTCDYLKIWLNVKLIWTLRITPKEAEAIETLAADNECDTENFVISAAELKEQRDFMDDNAELCSGASFESFK